MNSSCSGGTPQASAAGPRLRLADQLLDVEQLRRIGLARLLRTQEFAAPAPSLRSDFSVSMPNSSLNSADEIGEAPGVVIEDGDVAAGHVGDVDLVPLLDQANDACRPC